MGDKIKLRLVGSPIGTTKRVRETVRGLGLRKVGSERLRIVRAGKTGIHDVQHPVGARDFASRAPHAFGLHRVGRGAQARGIHQIQG